MNLTGTHERESEENAPEAANSSRASQYHVEASLLSGRALLVTDKRNVAVDVFRGVLMIAMLFVDVCGDYVPVLSHAKWEGLHLADFVMPGFLFIAGSSLNLALSRDARRMVQGGNRWLGRCLRMILLGIALQGPWIPVFTRGKDSLGLDLEQFRIMGILQRVGLCLLILRLIVTHIESVKSQIAVVLSLLALHSIISALNLAPGCSGETPYSVECNVQSYIDRVVMGRAHLYDSEAGCDPEGLLGTVACVFTMFCGFLVYHPVASKSKVRLALGSSLILCGILLNLIGFPFIKAIWTLSFNLCTTGACTVLIAILDRLPPRIIENSQIRKLGTNAIVFFVLSDCGGGASSIINSFWVSRQGQKITIVTWLMNDVLYVPHYPFMILVYALVQLSLLMMLTDSLYKNRLFFKV